VSRGSLLRLRDILAACDAIADYLQRAEPDDDMLYDAIRVRLIEIGEAVKDVPPSVFASEPSIPWSEVMRMRDSLAHRYFDSSKTVVWVTANEDVPELAAAVRRIIIAQSRA